MKRMRIHSFHSIGIAGALSMLLMCCTATSPSPEGVGAAPQQAPVAQAVPTATAGSENVVLCDGQRTIALPADMRGEPMVHPTDKVKPVCTFNI